MTDINYWFDEYKKEVEQFIQIVEKLQLLANSSNTNAIETSIRECEFKVGRIKEIKKSFGLELRLIKDRNEKREFDSNARELDSKFNEYIKIMTQSKATANKTELTRDANKNVYSTDGKDNDTLLKEADHIQDLTFESLARTRNMIEQSKEIGEATVSQLQVQQQQIVDIELQVDILDSNLVRAEKLVSNFTRRMATDKIIQCFTTINIVVLLGLILYIAISGKSLTNIGKSSGSSSGNTGPTIPSRIPSFQQTFGPTS